MYICLVENITYIMYNVQDCGVLLTMLFTG